MVTLLRRSEGGGRARSSTGRRRKEPPREPADAHPQSSQHQHRQQGTPATGRALSGARHLSKRSDSVGSTKSATGGSAARAGVLLTNTRAPKSPSPSAGRRGGDAAACAPRSSALLCSASDAFAQQFRGTPGPRTPTAPIRASGSAFTSFASFSNPTPDASFCTPAGPTQHVAAAPPPATTQHNREGAHRRLSRSNTLPPQKAAATCTPVLTPPKPVNGLHFVPPASEMADSPHTARKLAFACTPAKDTDRRRRAMSGSRSKAAAAPAAAAADSNNWSLLSEGDAAVASKPRRSAAAATFNAGASVGVSVLEGILGTARPIAPETGSTATFSTPAPEYSAVARASSTLKERGRAGFASGCVNLNNSVGNGAASAAADGGCSNALKRCPTAPAPGSRASLANASRAARAAAGDASAAAPVPPQGAATPQQQHSWESPLLSRKALSFTGGVPGGSSRPSTAAAAAGDKVCTPVRSSGRALSCKAAPRPPQGAPPTPPSAKKVTGGGSGSAGAKPAPPSQDRSARKKRLASLLGRKRDRSRSPAAASREVCTPAAAVPSAATAAAAAASLLFTPSVLDAELREKKKKKQQSDRDATAALLGSAPTTPTTPGAVGTPSAAARRTSLLRPASSTTTSTSTAAAAAASAKSVVPASVSNIDCLWSAPGKENMNDYAEGGYFAAKKGGRLGPNGRYHIVAKLGWGGFSTVWLCWDEQAYRKLEGVLADGGKEGAGRTAMEQFVAVKVSKCSASILKSTQEEINVLKYLAERLDEPGQKLGRSRLVTMLDDFSQEGKHGTHLCMVFPVMGQNLLTLVEQGHRHEQSVGKGVSKGMRSEEDKQFVKDTVRNLLLGMAAMSELSIVHTDLKPENILLTAVSQRIRKLMRGYQDELRSARVVDVPQALLVPTTPVYAETPLSGPGHDASRALLHHPPSSRSFDPLSGVKISDFGLAIPMDPTVGSTRHQGYAKAFARAFEKFGIKRPGVAQNTCGVTMQTREYRAPEILYGSPFTCETDVWSAGCIVFELITGSFLMDPKKPVKGASAAPKVEAQIDIDHVCLAQQLIGEHTLSPAAGVHAHKYFSPDTAFKYRSRVARHFSRRNLEGDLMKFLGSKAEAAGAASFIQYCLSTHDPFKRPTAADCLRHPWLDAGAPAASATRRL